MITTAQLTKDYISQHPGIKECLKKGLINYSALARMISEKKGIQNKSSIAAVLVAATRYGEELRKEKNYEKDVIELLKSGGIEAKNRIAVVIVEKNILPESMMDIEKEAKKKGNVFNAIEGSLTITVIISQSFIPELKKKFGNSIIKSTENLIEIIIKTGEKIEKIPGVVSYLTSLLAENNINIIEIMSCWTDTIIIIEEKDFSKSVELLRFG